MIRALALIATILFLAGMGYHQFTKTIYHSMDCDQFNIDHIELRTGINVPRVVSSDCNLSNNDRTVRFELSRGLKVSEYVERNEFADKQGDWLVKSGRSAETQWTSRLDTSHFVLEFDLVYLD